MKRSSAFGGIKACANSLMSFFLPMLGPRAKIRMPFLILDIGCGTGALFPALERYGSVSGIDISAEAVAYARRRGGVTVRQGEAPRLPYDGNTFDVVACSDLLYHAQVADDGAVLAEIYRVLKPGGALIIKEAAYNWLRSRMDELVHTKRRYTVWELKRKIESAHLRVERITYCMSILFPLALTVRLFERLHPPSYQATELFTFPSVLNALFAAIARAEAFLLRRLNFPFGLSIIAAARKPQALIAL